MPWEGVLDTATIWELIVFCFVLLVFWARLYCGCSSLKPIKRSQKLVNKNCCGKSLSDKVFVKRKTIANIFHLVKCRV